MTIRRLLAVGTMSAILLSGCTPGDRTIGPDGGSAKMPQDDRVEVVVPPGAIEGSARIELSPADGVPQPLPATTQIGTAVEVKTSRPAPGARILMPVDPGALDAAGTRDYFIAVYSDSLETWIPLPTDYDPAQRRVSAIAPHFSKFAVWEYAVPASRKLAGGVEWVGSKVGDVVHDAFGGVKNFAGKLFDDLATWYQGEEVTRPDCGSADSGWAVQSSAEQVTGCVVADNGRLRLRIGNVYRVPFTLRGPAGSDIGLTESDFELDLIDLILRGLNGGAGLGSLPKRGTTSLGLADTDYPFGASISVSVQPDILGTALQVVLGLLSGMPGSKVVLTERVDRVFAEELWVGRTGSYFSYWAHVSSTVTRRLGKSKEAESVETFIEAGKCVTRNIEGIVSQVRTRDASALAQALVNVAVECTGLALKATESASEPIWQYLKGLLVEAPNAVRQVVESISLGFTHLGGHIDLTATRVNPNLTLGRAWSRFTEGFGTVRPSRFFLGGASATGEVDGVSWSTWGGPKAKGSGTGAYLAPGRANAEARRSKATIVAWDVGDCGGQQAYRRLSWYYPQYGESLDKAPAFNICRGPDVAPDAVRWVGSYNCLQGLTGLTLEVSVVSGTSLSAVFSFYPVPENSNLPSGKFSMTGRYSGDVISLFQQAWISKPANYEMVDLQGSVSSDGSKMTGRVTTPGCTTFSLTRTR